MPFNSIKTCKWWVDSSSLDMGAILHFWTYLVKIRYSRGFRILYQSGTMNSIYFLSIFNAKSDYRLSIKISRAWSLHTFKTRSFLERILIHYDREISGPARWWCNVTSLVLTLLDYTSHYSFLHWATWTRSEERWVSIFWSSRFLVVHMYPLVSFA